jgi:hypothetical protein
LLAALAAAVVAAPVVAQVDFLSIASAQNQAAINIAGTTAINSAIAASASPGRGPTTAQIEARERYNAERLACLTANLDATVSGTPARRAGREACNARFPVRKASDFPAGGVGGSAPLATATSSAALAQRAQYRATPAIEAEVEAELYQSLARLSREQADEVQRVVFSQDIETLFGDTVRPFGLRSNDLSHAMTAYWVGMWVIANNAPNPTNAQIAEVRAQLLNVLAVNGTLDASDADKQRLSQAMMLETYLGLVAFNDMRVDRRSLADATAENLRRRGLDMRRMVITDRGFAPR